jgi:hypothetical protein
VTRAALETLTLGERGFVLGLAGAGAAPAVARRLAGGGGARCEAALEALGRERPEARADALAALAGEVRASFPRGLERAHPGWVRRALADEPAEVVRAVTEGLPAEVAAVAGELLDGREEGSAEAPRWRPQAVAELRRALLGGLAPMPAEQARPLDQLAPSALLDEIDTRGAALLGRSLEGAPHEVVARAAAGVGAPLGRQVLAAARGGREAPGAGTSREAARALVAAAARRPGLGAARGVGLQALARELAREGWDAVLAVAQRLPPALGDALAAVAAATVGEGD